MTNHPNRSRRRQTFRQGIQSLLKQHAEKGDTTNFEAMTYLAEAAGALSYYAERECLNTAVPGNQIADMIKYGHSQAKNEDEAAKQRKADREKVRNEMRAKRRG
jgi:hypothetical protein